MSEREGGVIHYAGSRGIEDLERDYIARKLAIREDAGLSWEKRELAIKALFEEYHRQLGKLRKLERKE
jgi:hypothetical protein